MSQLSPKTHLGYGIADFGQNLLFQIVSIFLLKFYTDTALLSAAFAGNLFLFSRIWDGLNDPIMGYLAQRTRSRWGTYRPWLLWMAIPVGLSFVALFYMPDFSLQGKQWYAIGTYLLFTMAFTALNIPYGTLTAVLTSDSVERGKLTGYRMTFAMVGAILAGYAFLPLTELSTDLQTGYLWAAGIFALILISTLLIGFFSIKEEVVIHRFTQPNLREGWRALLQNRPFWMLCITFGSCFAAYAVFMSILPYFGQYFLGDPSLTPTLLLAVMGMTAVSIPGWTWLSKRWGKRSIFLMGSACYLLAMGAIFFLTSDPSMVVYACMILYGIGNGAVVLTSWAMIADTVEYGEWKTGLRLESMLYGVYGFFIKLGIGIGIWLAGQGLEMGGYIANVDQSSDTLRSIQLLLSAVPCLWIVIACLAMWTYHIDTELHLRIRKELEV